MTVGVGSGDRSSHSSATASSGGQKGSKPQGQESFLAPGVFRPAAVELWLFALLEEIFEVVNLGVVRRGTLTIVKKVGGGYAGGRLSAWGHALVVMARRRTA